MRVPNLASIVFSAVALSALAEEAPSPKPVLEIAEPAAMTLERVPFKTESELTGVAWSPDGRSIASCEEGTTLTIWSASSGHRVKSWSTERLIARAIAWSPVGDLVVVGFADEVAAWDAKTGQLKRRIPHREIVVALAFLPGTARLVSAGEFGELKLTDLSGTGEPIVLPSPCKSIRSIAISEDGNRLAIGGNNPPAAVVDLSKGEVVQRYGTDLAATVTWVEWSVQKHGLLARFESGPVCEFDSATGEKFRIHDGFRTSGLVALGRIPESDDLLASYQSGYSFRKNARRDTADWTHDRTQVGSVRSERPIVAVSPKGASVALRWSKDEFAVLDATSGNVRIGGETKNKPKFLAWSPDGKSLFTSRGGSEVQAFDSTTGQRLRGYVAAGNQLLGLAAREDGALLAASFGAAWLRVTDLTNGHDLVREVVREVPAYAALSQDGRIFAWWQDDVLRVRDLTGMQELPSIRALAEPKSGYATLSPRGDILIQFGTERRRVVYSDTETGAVLREMAYGDSMQPTAGVLSQDGSLTALCGKWGQLQICFSGQRFPVELNFRGNGIEGIRFAPEGRRLAVLDQRLHVFDLREADAMGQWWSLSPAQCLAWSPDGRLVATLHKDGATRVWDIPMPAPQERSSLRDPILDWGELACQRADRAFEAAGRLERGGTAAAALLREKLAEKENQPHIRDLIVQLADESFVRRQSAREELHWLGVQAEPELLRAIAGQPPGAWRSELESLIRLAESRVGPSSQNLRRQRAMQVLEGIGSTEATDVLRHLSSESPSPRERSDAQDALRRIEMRSAK
ncbi:MAG: WD40 repeat domain-containing protein [Planctomycetota bacterium]